MVIGEVLECLGVIRDNIVVKVLCRENLRYLRGW